MKPVVSGDPPVAVVTGKSLMQLDVASQVVIQRVELTWVGGDKPQLRTYASEPFEEELEWSVLLGGKGERVIKAEAFDSEGNTDAVTLNVRVE